jgi:hypothetical protein
MGRDREHGFAEVLVVPGARVGVVGRISVEPVEVGYRGEVTAGRRVVRGEEQAPLMLVPA